MWQRNQIKFVPGAFNSEPPADNRLQARTFDELRDGQPSHRHNQARPKYSDFFVEPGGTVANLIRRRHPITAAWSFTRKAAANRREINFGADFGFGKAAKSLQPQKQSSAGRPCEWFLQYRLTRSRCLTNKHYLAEDWPA